MTNLIRTTMLMMTDAGGQLGPQWCGRLGRQRLLGLAALLAAGHVGWQRLLGLAALLAAGVACTQRHSDCHLAMLCGSLTAWWPRWLGVEIACALPPRSL